MGTKLIKVPVCWGEKLTWLVTRRAGHVICVLLTTARAVFYIWLGRVGWSRDHRPTNYGMGPVFYTWLLGRVDWSRDQPPTNYGMGRLLYLAGPGGLVT